MSKLSKPELSKKNPYWIEKEKMYELQHFCRQYPGWKKQYGDISIQSRCFDEKVKTSFKKDDTATNAIRQAQLSEKIKLVEDSAVKTDPILGSYILIGVTTDVSYNWLRTHTNIPCGRNTYHDLRRRFFYILSQVR